MSQAGTSSRRLRPVFPAELPQALAEALDGRAPVAPLPQDEAERRLTLEMLGLDEPVVEPGAAAVVATSGSTGRPKGVVLSRSAIAASAKATHGRLGGSGEWVLALPAHYVAGLMVVARTVLAGTRLHLVPGDLTGLPELPPAPGRRRYLSLVPTQLVRALRDGELRRALARMDAVLVGGAATDPGLLQEARRHGIGVVTTYGMSETCGGCVYDGRPLDGVDVQLETETSRILLGGPSLFSGYRLRPDLTAAALSGGRLRTADRGAWDGRLLAVEGRVDDVVISGGVNVDLAAVQRVVASWPGLGEAEVVVVGVPDPEWGARVVAVTDASGSVGTEDQLTAYLRARLPAAAVPRQVVRLALLPRTSNGKIDRQRLTKLIAGAPIPKQVNAQQGGHQ